MWFALLSTRIVTEINLPVQKRCKREMDWTYGVGGWVGGGCYMYNRNASDSDERLFHTAAEVLFSFLFFKVDKN